MVLLNDVERFFIDGYSIEDPVGLHGEDIRIDLVGMRSRVDIKKTLGSLAKFLGLNFSGVFNLDTVLLVAEKEFKDIKNAVFINILKEHVSLFLLRKGSLVAIDNLSFGYGLFEKEYQKSFR